MSTPPHPNIVRRRILATTGIASGAVLAGCLGDDDDEDDEVDDVEDTTDDRDEPGDDTPVDDHDDSVADDGDDRDSTADDGTDIPEIERYDIAPVHHRGPPLPADATYAAGFGDANQLPDWVVSEHAHYYLISRSIYDSRFASNTLDQWDYEPGLLEFTFRDDIYWWSGDQMDAIDFITHEDLSDFTDGGDDLNANPNIIAREVIDDRTVRISLADVWNEEWAITQSILDSSISASTAFTSEWLERFEDTGADMDAVAELRDDIL